ncbi:MAG: choice-of-anchor D domain-containing protein [Acidobacteriota bacterium]
MPQDRRAHVMVHPSALRTSLLAAGLLLVTVPAARPSAAAAAQSQSATESTAAESTAAESTAAESTSAESTAAALAQAGVLPIPNPYLAFLPAGIEPDWQDWRRKMARLGSERRAAPGRQTSRGLAFAEVEAAGDVGDNDLPVFAQPLPGAGTGPGETSRFEITGALLAPPRERAPTTEPDDAIPSARSLAVSTGIPIAVRGVVGDGAFADSSGDFDFYRLAASAGQRLEVAVRTERPLADLDPIVGIYDGSGNLLDVNDNLPGSGFLLDLDSFLTLELPADGDYFLTVGGHSNPPGFPDDEDLLPSDPFDGGSGPGAGSLGNYTLIVGLDAPGPASSQAADRDAYRLDLRRGDVVGANLLRGARRLALIDPNGEERIAANGTDLSGIYPDSSPFPGGGNAAIAYVADREGTWTLTVSNPPSFDRGAYGVEVELARGPLLSGSEPARPILFVDFDGAEINPAIFNLLPGSRPFSPLADFLPRWGLTASDENALIDDCLATVAENLQHDLALLGGNGDFPNDGLFGSFDLEIRNSRDHPDPWGEPWVSRVVVGGTVNQLGALTIGLAESIDPGNFAAQETAVVLLDFLSAPPDDINSLNGVELAPEATRRDLVAQALGNLVAHEAGHLFANFHTERDQGPSNLMDRGGRLSRIVGLGEDEIFGSADDEDVDFGRDRYSPVEAFEGIEDTLASQALTLVATGPRGELLLRPGSLDFGPIPVAARRELVVEVSNPGSESVVVGPLALSGSAFSFTGPATFELAPGERRGLTVAFTAASAGEQRGQLSGATSLPDGSRLELALVGQGGVPRAQVTPQNADFGELTYGDVAIESLRSFTVTNQGDGPLALLPPLFSGRDPTRFESAGRNELRLAAGESRDLQLAFRPRGQVGAMSATAHLRFNDPITGRIDLTLTGVAQGPDVAIAPGPVYFFGGVRVGTARDRVFVLSNTGTRPLSFGQASLEGPDVAEFAITAGGAGGSLGADATTSLTVRFSPAVRDQREALLVIPTDDPDEPRVEVTLVGLGTEPELATIPEARDFGSVGVGASAVRFVRVVNVGENNLTVTGSRLTAGDFALEDGGAPFTLTPDGERALRLRFSPDGLGPRSAELALGSDDPARPTVVVPLTGFGSQPQLLLSKTCARVTEGRAACDLEVHNGGPGAAAAVEVFDFLPAGTTWLGDDCSAGAPEEGVWSWSIGELEDGEARRCRLDLALPSTPTALINRAAVRSFLTPPDDFDDLAEAELAPAAAVEIPALGGLGLVLLGLLLAAAGGLALRYR